MLKGDIAYVVNELVQSIPAKSFESYSRKTSCPAYHPKMMMKIQRNYYVNALSSLDVLCIENNEIGFALMAVNIRKYTANNKYKFNILNNKKGSDYLLYVIKAFFFS